MKLFLCALFFSVMGYYSYKFIQVLLKMNQNVVLPITDDELQALRKYPEKAVNFPTFSKQKGGIIVYSLVLLFVLVMFILGLCIKGFDWSFFLLIFLPFTHSDNLLNMFAVVEGGVLSGNRFIPWGKIKSFQFVPITMDHRFYGFDKEVNAGYELIIKTKLFSTSCVVTSDDMKEKLTAVLSEHVAHV
ncbi:hypothetical protein [Bacillus sp. REN10]|uniref:hypothetical protein n=1 Tax=Bacillus sp. REN10 TaxID=2782541 RepID=UPI00193B7C91|nr:hypothetical protein [Bacillus sp. REN10]